MLTLKPESLKKNAALIVALVLILVGSIELFYTATPDLFVVFGFLVVGAMFIPIWLGQRK